MLCFTAKLKIINSMKPSSLKGNRFSDTKISGYTKSHTSVLC